MNNSQHISSIPSTHQAAIVLVNYKMMQETFKKTVEERALFKKLRHTLKRMKVSNRSQPTSQEKRLRSIK